MLDPSFLRKRKSRWTYPLESLFFHLAVLIALLGLERASRIGALQKALDQEKKEKTFLVKPISEEEFKRNFPRNMVVDTEIQNPLQEKAKDRAKYFGEKTQRVKEETRAEAFGSPRAGVVENLFKPNFKEKFSGVGKGVKPDTVGKPLEKGEKSKLQRGNFNVLDSDVKISSQTILNTDEYVYSTFYNRMREAIAVFWEPKVREIMENRFSNLTPGIYKTETKIYLSRSGEVLEVEIIRPSGIQRLDDIATSSISQAHVFLNPPSQLFKVDPRAGLDFGFYVHIYPRKMLRFGYEPDQRLKRSY